MTVQAADGDVPREINPQQSETAPEILIMPQKGEKQEGEKKEKRCHINNL